MGVGHGRSRLLDLASQVSSRVIHPDWFATRTYCRLGRGEWEADIRIIDGGHSISFRYRDIRISEVLASQETRLPEEGILHRSPVGDDGFLSFCPGGIVSYQTSREVERLDREVFRHLDQEMTLDPARGDLFFRFAPTNRLAPAPISRIHFEPMQRGLAMHAYHTFPDECAILRIQSLFEAVSTA